MLSTFLKLSAMLLSSVELTPATAPQTDLNAVEQAILKDTNAERARYGLPALTLDPSLEATARRHAAWMTNSHNLQHSSIGVAENIAWGQHSAEEAMSSWMSSSGHRANILNGSYRRIGVAAYTATDGSCYWCQQFLQ